ncbi:YciI family protein [Nonomuraea sp. NPDC004702]
MRYLVSVIDDKSAPGSTDRRPAISAFNERLIAEGYWVFSGGLADTDAAMVIDNRGEQAVVSDGPFVESKEYLAGVWVWEAPRSDRRWRVGRRDRRRRRASRRARRPRFPQDALRAGRWRRLVVDERSGQGEPTWRIEFEECRSRKAETDMECVDLPTASVPLHAVVAPRAMCPARDVVSQTAPYLRAGLLQCDLVPQSVERGSLTTHVRARHRKGRGRCP